MRNPEKHEHVIVIEVQYQKMNEQSNKIKENMK